MKVRLVDGITVVHGTRATIWSHCISGVGDRYALVGTAGLPTSAVRMDIVAGVEAFSDKMLIAPALNVRTAATATGIVATIGLAIAILGSCATVHADTPDGPKLEPEGVSCAISPLMEHRDLDTRRLRPGADGVIPLALINEARETHFINYLDAVSVRHAGRSRVVPDQGGRTVVVSGSAAVTLPTSWRTRESALGRSPFATSRSCCPSCAPGTRERSMRRSRRDATRPPPSRGVTGTAVVPPR